MFQGDEVAGDRGGHRRARATTPRGWCGALRALPHFANVEQAMAPDAPKVFAGAATPREGNREETGRSRRRLQAGRARRRADLLDARHHARAASRRTARVCEWDGDKLTAWVSTQACPRVAQAVRARGSKIPQANVRVITQYMGGGFGSKSAPDAQGLICAKLAQQAKVAGQADARSQGRASRQPATVRRRPRTSAPASRPTAR